MIYSHQHKGEAMEKGDLTVVKGGKRAAPRTLAIRPSIAERLFEEAQAIEAEDAYQAGTVRYMARTLAQATLPYREPDPELPAWGRRAGKVSLVIQPGYYFKAIDGKNVRQCIGYPYGALPRLVLAWLATEARRTDKPELVLGETLKSFMQELGYDTMRGGKRGNITLLREQMKRLFASTMSVVYGDNAEERKPFNVANGYSLWWDTQRPEQAGLWQSTVTLSHEFFEEIVKSPVPVDMRALKALRQSPMAIDLYCWLTYRMFSLGKTTMVPWESLMLQFGSDAASERKFKEAMKRALLQVKEVYPGVDVRPERSGLELRPSPTSVASRIGTGF